MNTRSVPLSELILPAKTVRAGRKEYPILSMTMHGGLVDQASKFKKRVASANTSAYKVVRRDQLVVGFPIDEGVLSFQRLHDAAVVSPAYDVWDIQYSKLVEPPYLERFLRSPVALTYYRAKLRGTTARRRSIPDEVFLRLQVPLPSLSEQRRIAAILDKVDEVRSKRRAALAQLDTLTQSIFRNLFGDPATNSKGLPTVMLGELGDWRSGGTPPRAELAYFLGHVPWFSSGELGDLYVHDSAEKVTTDALINTTARAVPAGALLLGMYDTAALKASIAAVDCSCNQAVAFAVIDQETADTLYVYHAIQVGREHFRRLRRGIRQKNLNLSMIRSIEIPRPTLRAQQEFRAVLESLTVLRRSMETEEQAIQQLLASVVDETFRGNY